MPTRFALKRLDEKKKSFGKPSSPNQKLPKTTFRIYAWSIGLLDRDLGSVINEHDPLITYRTRARMCLTPFSLRLIL